VVPVAVFALAGLWTYLTYFAILFPVHFLTCGVAARKLKPAATIGIVGALAAAMLSVTWRSIYLLLGLANLVLVPILIFAIPQTTAAQSKAARPDDGLNLRQAARTRQFWLLLAVYACAAFLSLWLWWRDGQPVAQLLGAVAARHVMGFSEGIMKLRGRWLEYRAGEAMVPVMPTLHPAYLLRQPAHKKLAWRDLQAAEQKIASLGLLEDRAAVRFSDGPAAELLDDGGKGRFPVAVPQVGS